MGTVIDLAVPSFIAPFFVDDFVALFCFVFLVQAERRKNSVANRFSKSPPGSP